MYSNVFKGKRVLVTGGTGSFGHQIVGRLMLFKPEEIRILSRDEEKQDKMRAELKGDDNSRGKNISLRIGDVRDYQSVRQAMRDIDIVFHAAALKQVPSCEYAPYEAVKTNILGAQNVIDAALEENVEKVIAVSTDKAVKPVNTMGMTKSIQERLMTVANFNKGSKRTIFSSVRYGNVVGSRGSVVPLFFRQILEGNDVTITDSTMTRFLLVLSEAIDLVFKAAADGRGGEVFVLNIPAATITDLAEVMIEELGAGKNISMKEIGIRPGEKIHEVLISEEESGRTVVNEDFYVILPSISLPDTLSHYREFEKFKDTEFASNNARRLSKAEIKDLVGRAGWLSPDKKLVTQTLVRSSGNVLDTAQPTQRG